MEKENIVIRRAVDAWVAQDAEYKEETEAYRRKNTGKLIFIFGCLIATIFIAGVALSLGEYKISFADTYRTAWNHLQHNILDKTADYVIWEMRLPRLFTGMLAGAGLAIAGAVMQTMLRNPLADPYTTGISAGASFGASLTVGLGLTFAGTYTLVINAFLFALVPMALIIMVSRMKGSTPTTMIMAGIAVMYIFNAMSTLIKLWVSPEALAALFAWSVGTIDGSNWQKVGTMLMVVTAGYLVLQGLARKLNVISTEDESAHSMGVNAKQLRILCLLVVSLLAAGVVSFTGLIGFVGLVCPHIVRMVVGSDNRYVIPASAAFGAMLLTLSDVIGRTLLSPTVIQVGVITAFIGGPVFAYLIVKQGRESA